METYKIAGREYPVSGYVTARETGLVPLVELPQMSDYKWQLTGLNDRLEHPEKYKAVVEDVEAVVSRLRRWLEEATA